MKNAYLGRCRDHQDKSPRSKRLAYSTGGGNPMPQIAKYKPRELQKLPHREAPPQSKLVASTAYNRQILVTKYHHSRVARHSLLRRIAERVCDLLLATFDLFAALYVKMPWTHQQNYESSTAIQTRWPRENPRSIAMQQVNSAHRPPITSDLKHLDKKRDFALGPITRALPKPSRTSNSS